MSTRKTEVVFSADALRDVLEQRLNIPLTSSFLVAYSGGCDSHVLLHALHALGVRLRVVYVDHGLQPDSAAWGEHCRATCAALGVACETERVDVRCENEESVEAAARRLRYERLARHMAPLDVLVTAHHRDDQAETLLLALMRGTGVHGLAAMPVIGSFAGGTHARPLLGIARAAIAAYAQRHALRWVEDRTNQDEKMARNFLRASVMPVLIQRWPGAGEMLARAADNNADAVALHDEIARLDLVQCSAPDATTLMLEPLRRFSPPRQRNLLRYWIRSNGFRAPSARHLDMIRSQADATPRTAHACIDWPGTEVRRYRDELTVRARTGEFDASMTVSWTPPQTIHIPQAGLRLCAATVRGRGLSQAKVPDGSLSVRFRRGGERCQLAGHPHRVTLKNLLQESGVPPWERERMPLIYVNDVLAAIGDRWVCVPFAAMPDEIGWQIFVEPAPLP